MIKGLVNGLTGKKTLEDYKKSIQFWSILLFFIASLTLIINGKLHLTSFGKGVLIGVALALFVLIGRNYYLLGNEKKLKDINAIALFNKSTETIDFKSGNSLAISAVLK